MDAQVILKNCFRKISLNLKKFFFLRKINKIIELNQDEIVVAIGIIIKPTVLK